MGTKLPVQPWVIDISHYQQVNSWEKVVAAGIVGVIHKATEGKTSVDSMYRARENGARSAGLLWGAYHFLIPNDIDAQVKNFLNVVGPSPSVLHALDYETTAKGQTVPIGAVAEWLEKVFLATGRWPMLYSGNVIKEQIKNASVKQLEIFAKCRLWLAQYGESVTWPAGVWPLPWLWQFTGGSGVGPQPHMVNGIVPPMCDIDSYVGGGTKEQLRSEWIPLKRGTTTTTSTTPTPAIPVMPAGDDHKETDVVVPPSVTRPIFRKKD